MTDPFEKLGLDKDTATETEVKSAYARLLKETRPEDDRDGFMALRDAFASARAIAKNRPAAPPPPIEPEPEPEPDSSSAPSPADATDTTPAEAAPEQPKWHRNERLQWNVSDTPQGQLIERTLLWMIDAGPDPDDFAADVAETLLANPQINVAQYYSDIISFVLFKGETDQHRYDVEDWEEVEVERPDWLTVPVMETLANQIKIFRHKPTKAWQARDHNMALKLFEPVLPKSEGFAPLDSKSMFVNEQNESHKDSFGSYFDAEKMAWVDQSPTGRAMRDFEDATQSTLWDSTDMFREILEREELQPLEEFQNLDARLREFVCRTTGFYSQGRTYEKPKWLTKPTMELLDTTFGWSRHYGRGDWERQQFDWLHKVSKRFAIPPPPKQAPLSTVPPPFETRPMNPGPSFNWAKPFWWMYKNSVLVLASYLTFRIVQTALKVWQ